MMNKLAASLFVFAVGCASATDGAFQVKGRLADSGHVTHVVATDAATGQRIITPVTSDDFAIALPPGKQWVVTFAEATKSGRDMQVATLQLGALDALVPQTDGSLDLGTVSFTAGRAHASAQWTDIIDALGIDDAAATRMGNTDNLALRLANPDIDNDGFIDTVAPMLNVAGAYRVKAGGSDLTVAQLVQGYDQTSIDYRGTTLTAAVPRSMNMAMQTGTLTFEQPFFGTALGDTPAIMPGTPIGSPYTKFGQQGGNNLIGVVSRAGHDAPSGTYELAFANGQLTFTDVMPPAAPVVESAQSYAVPFVRITPTNAACEGTCSIDSLDLDWKMMTAAGWSATSEQPAHVDIVLQHAGKRTYLAADMTGSSLAWQNIDVTNTGILWTELSYFTTQSICYIGVSYQSELGMKMTNELYNPGCF